MDPARCRTGEGAGDAVPWRGERCQESQAQGNWGTGPTEEGLLGCPPA